jgi:hypothetical protein
MDFLIYIIPFLVSVFLLAFFRKKVVWWEYIVMIAVPIVVSLIVRLIMVSYNNTDTEYLGDYITKVRHYDDWDEWVHRTCTRTVKSGKTTITQTYDCSYRQYHPERWSYFDQDGEEHWLFYEEEFDEIVRRFGTKMIFVDMHRRYYTDDGDAQEYRWNGSEKTAWPVTHSHTYKNKLQNSRSIFNFEEIDKEYADSIGLYDYPPIEMYDQNPILSHTIKLPKNQEDALRYTNGFYGKKHQFRVFVLLFENKDIEISEKQRSYWKGGNKNELVVCLGVKDNKVDWCNAFSWCDVPTIDVKTETFFTQNDTLDIKAYSDLLRESLDNGEWVRKNFEDFSYLKPELSLTQQIWILVISILLNVGFAIFVIKNNFENENF